MADNQNASTSIHPLSMSLEGQGMADNQNLERRRDVHNVSLEGQGMADNRNRMPPPPCFAKIYKLPLAAHEWPD